MEFDGAPAIADIKAGKKMAPRIDTGATPVTKANSEVPENKTLPRTARGADAPVPLALNPSTCLVR